MMPSSAVIRTSASRAGMMVGVFLHRAMGARRLAALVILLTTACFAAVARAEPVAVLAQPTDLTSSSELMISYRHQEHMWQTPDGALHLVVNRGTLRPNPGLVLV